MTSLGLSLFLFPEGNECCLCFVILAHRWIEPKSHIQTTQTETPNLELEILTGSLIHWDRYLFVRSSVFSKLISFSSWVYSKTTFSSSFVVRFGPCDELRPLEPEWNYCIIIFRPSPYKPLTCNLLPSTFTVANDLRHE